ncbi:MAG: hypothetical protein LBR07_00480 [Puniceicoccales bacterium]|nr:hypothetical protein [Puniceicoccales bacterium]
MEKIVSVPVAAAGIVARRRLSPPPVTAVVPSAVPPMISHATTLLLAGVAAHPVPGSKTILIACWLGWIVAMTLGARQGYHRGPVRQLAPALALVAAVAGAWFFGAETGHSLLKHTGLPWVLRGPAGMLLTGAVLWLVVFSIVWRVGRNRLANALGEAEHPVAGTVVGCWTGMFAYAALVLGVCAAGAVGQFWLDTSGAGESFKADVIRWPVRVKNSLARQNGLGWLARWNPMPARTRRTLEKGALVVRTNGALEALRDLPAVRAIGTDPAFYPLTRDEEIRRLVRERDVDGLVSHPLVLRLVGDDDFQRRLTEVDLEALFDEALTNAAAGAAARAARRARLNAPPASSAPSAAPSAASPDPLSTSQRGGDSAPSAP